MHWTLQADLGYSSLGFGDVTGADFNSMKGFTYRFGVARVKDNWNYGFRYSVVSGIKVDPFYLSSGETGSFSVEYQRMHFTTGYSYPFIQALFILGVETSKWKGSPEPGQKTAQDSQFGFEVSHNFFDPLDTTPSYKITTPLSIQVLSLSKRTVTFDNYPKDSIVAKGGIAYDITMGVAIEF